MEEQTGGAATDKEMPEMEKLIERLRMERDAEAWKAEGLKQGTEHAARLSYREFIVIIANYDDLLMRGVSDAQDIEDLMESDWFAEHVSNLREKDPSFNEEFYLVGWLVGVLQVWTQVEDKL
jgi:hypothetical protein